MDYGLGNLFSVKHACAHAGMEGHITADRGEIIAADVVFLPGVGAYGDAMRNLRQRDLVGPLQDIAASGGFLVGICLGQQLLMTESYEFGHHQGLNIIRGDVVRFENPVDALGGGDRVTRRPLKVPQVCWNQIFRPEGVSWEGTPLAGQSDGEFMYFVHSFYTRPENPAVILAMTRYGGITFCSALRHGRIFAFQYHPERSGPQGLRVYQQIAALVRQQREVNEHV